MSVLTRPERFCLYHKYSTSGNLSQRETDTEIGSQEHTLRRYGHQREETDRTRSRRVCAAAMQPNVGSEIINSGVRRS